MESGMGESVVKRVTSGVGMVMPTAYEAGLLMGSAMERSDWERLQELLEAGVNPDVPLQMQHADGGRPALPTFARSMPAQAMELLLSYGANPDGCAQDRATAAMRTLTPLPRFDLNPSADELVKKLDLLARYGANFDAGTGSAALTVALSAVEYDRDAALVVEALLAGGASPIKETGSGSKPLEIACTRGFLKTSLALIDAGADLWAPRSPSAKVSCAYDIALITMKDGCEELVARAEQALLRAQTRQGVGKKALSI